MEVSKGFSTQQPLAGLPIRKEPMNSGDESVSRWEDKENGKETAARGQVNNNKNFIQVK